MSVEILLGCVGIIFMGMEIFVGIIFKSNDFFFLVVLDICLSYCWMNL